MPSPPSSDAVAHAKYAVRAADLTRVYGTPASPVPALRGVSLEIADGERVALLGKSGSGKSTLLNLLGGLDRPTSGALQVGGQDLAAMGSRQLARFRSTTVGMIFQAFNLVASRTALQNVELPMIFNGTPHARRRRIATEALTAVGLGDRLQHRPNQLSGGETQRVAVARSLVNRPRIILADEPTGNLDSSTAREVIELIMQHVAQHRSTFILVTHDEELAATCTTRVIRLKDGQLLA
ncbi:MAG TPA: ABC transporter ATP-binding protein [Planctomycetaceae bacterium]|nr:ABC transporter ATP-binding protein [Planctomycetaceae bacterium]